MKGQPEPEQGSVGLGKKVQEIEQRACPPEHDWKYIGNNIWRNGKGQLHNAQPTPETPSEQWWRIYGKHWPDATFIDSEWYL